MGLALNGNGQTGGGGGGGVTIDTTSTDYTSSAQGDATAAGSTGKAADAGHKHGRESFGSPGNSAVGDAAAAGTAATPARSDHTHGREAFGTPGSSAVGDAAAAGTATTVAHSDHVHGRESFGSPGNSAVGDAAAAGVATTSARSDHKHGREAFANPGASYVGDAISGGVATTEARSDHTHGRETFGHDVKVLNAAAGWIGQGPPGVPQTMARDAITVVSGTVYVMRVQINDKASPSSAITNISYYINTAGSGLTSGDNFVGLYTKSGTKLGASADQTTNFGATGLHTVALVGGPFTDTDDWCYVAILCVGTTAAKFQGMSSPGAVQNAGMAAASMICAANATGQTSLPASLTLSSNVANQAIWVAVS